MEILTILIISGILIFLGVGALIIFLIKKNKRQSRPLIDYMRSSNQKGILIDDMDESISYYDFSDEPGVQEQAETSEDSHKVEESRSIKFQRRKPLKAQDPSVQFSKKTIRPAGRVKERSFTLSLFDLEEEDRGRINLDYPSEMRAGLKYDISAKIFQDIKQAYESEFKESIELRVSSIMKVELFTEPNKFEVQSLSTLEQSVEKNAPTKWEWRVRPLESGLHKITIKASIKIKSEFGAAFKDIDVLIKQIPVRINPVFSTQQFVSQNYVWILGLLFGSGMIFKLLEYLGIVKVSIE